MDCSWCTMSCDYYPGLLPSFTIYLICPCGGNVPEFCYGRTGSKHDRVTSYLADVCREFPQSFQRNVIAVELLAFQVRIRIVQFWNLGKKNMCSEWLFSIPYGKFLDSFLKCSTTILQYFTSLMLHLAKVKVNLSPGTPRWHAWEPDCSYTQGCTNLWRQAAMGTKFCTLALNICGSSVWNMLHVSLLTPRILR
jgi:hypothetical protein